MRRIKNKSVLISICMVLIFLAGIATPSVPADAARKPEFQEAWDLYRTGSEEMDTNYLPFSYLPKKARVTKVVSDRPKIAEAFVHTWSDGEQNVGIRIRKTGTVNLKIRVKVGKKSYNLKSRITIRKHRNLFSSFNVGKENIRKLYNRAEYADVNMPAGKRRIRIRLAKGWKLQKITYEQGKKIRTLKNGRVLNFDKLEDGARMDITVQEEKSGRIRSFQVYFYKPGEEPEIEETQPESSETRSTESETQSTESETQSTESGNGTENTP